MAIVYIMYFNHYHFRRKIQCNLDPESLELVAIAGLTLTYSLVLSQLKGLILS